MKRLLLIAIGAWALTGCHKDSPGKKIVDSLPLSTAPLMVQPAQATQQFLLLNNAALNISITSLNRLNGILSSVMEGPDASMIYTVRRSESHYGTATFTIQFQDVNHAAIDPFTTVLTTTSVQYVHITVAAGSTAFPTVTEDLSLILDTVGFLIGPYHLKGTAQFDNASYSIAYALDPNGVEATINGLLHGHATATSTSGSPKITSSDLSFGIHSDISGKMLIDDQTDGIYVSANGSGYLTTSDSRVLFQ
jgi:hypothetical protein